MGARLRLAKNRSSRALRYSLASALSGMRLAASSNLVRNAARNSGVESPLASRSKSYNAWARGTAAFSTASKPALP